MVHGNFYGIQYEIHLSKSLDLYDDILPICSQVRSMLTYDEQKQKIIVIDYKKFNKRFESKPLALKYASSLDTAAYNKTYVNELPEDKVKEINEFKDVRTYSNLIKHKDSDLIKPLDPKAFLELKARYDELNIKAKEVEFWLNSNKDQYIELSKLDSIIQIQSIVADSEYLKKITNLEQELCTIELEQNETDLIKLIESHPKLEGIISYSGINLIQGYY